MPDILISQFDRKFALPIETWRTVNNLTTRDSIPTNIRWAGMIVYVQSESLSYILQGGVDNSDWVELGSLVNVTVVDDLLSTSPTDALSANQGRILKDLIDNIDPTVEWGDIGGTLADQTDLSTALGSKLNLAGGTLTGSLSVPDNAFGVGWNGSAAVPTRNAVYDEMITKLPSSSYTAADVLAKLLTVDGSGSGLDADLLDGLDSSKFFFLQRSDLVDLDAAIYAGSSYRWGSGAANRPSNFGTLLSVVNEAGDYNGVNNWLNHLAFGTDNNVYFRQKINVGAFTSWVKLWHSGNGGSGSGLDADLLRGVHWGNVNTDISTSGNLNLTATATESKALQIGHGRSGNGNSWIDLVGDATYADYGLRLIRNNGGANTTSDILHRGTGALRLIASEAAAITLGTTGTTRLTIAAAGTITATSTITATNFILSSDKRLKYDIREFNGASVPVDWVTFKTKDSPLETRYGVVAQDLEAIAPEFVVTDEKGFKSVKYIDLLVAKVAEIEHRLKNLEHGRA